MPRSFPPLLSGPSNAGAGGVPSPVAIDNRDLVPAPRQRDRGVQPGGPCPDDDCPHAVPAFRPVKAMVTPSATLVSGLSPGIGCTAAASLGDALGNRRRPADKTPASGQASPPLNHPEETACRLIHRRSAGPGNCDQARPAVPDHAMVPSRRAVPARARPGCWRSSRCAARRAQLRDSRDAAPRPPSGRRVTRDGANVPDAD
jgi:hypothetical protein